MRGTRGTWGSVLVVCALALGGCMSDLPGEQRMTTGGRDGGTDVTVPSVGYKGRWNGKTGQGMAVRFAMSEAGLTRLELGWTIGSCDFNTTLDFDRPAPIDGDTFSSTIEMGPGKVFAEVAITFASDSEAAGSITFSVDAVPDAPACAGLGLTTFTATKS